MKTLILAVSLLIATNATTNAQVKSVTEANHQTTAKTASSHNPANATRSRVLGQKKKTIISERDVAGSPSFQAHAKAEDNVATEAARVRRFAISGDSATPNMPTVGANGTSPATTADNIELASPVVNNLPPVSAASTRVYRVGAYDVLDIQLGENPNRKSTLFTVLEGGLLEYPLAGDPIAVVGLTTAEIAALLRQRIKIFENPTVVVNVRDYASHSVTITGFVGSPGKKILRREAVPLFALMSEALVLPEAARAMITRQGRPSLVLDLKDPIHSATLIVSGDVIKITGLPPTPTEFFFVGGAINSPGQKPYHAGLTLTQAILASGGTSSKAGPTVKISRLGSNGRLINEAHDLRKIQTGRAPDPLLKKGDRIEILSVN